MIPIPYPAQSPHQYKLLQLQVPLYLPGELQIKPFCHFYHFHPNHISKTSHLFIKQTGGDITYQLISFCISSDFDFLSSALVIPLPTITTEGFKSR